jgi:hypothetical protein
MIERGEQQEGADDRADAEVEEQLLLRQRTSGLTLHERPCHRK